MNKKTNNLEDFDKKFLDARIPLYNDDNLSENSVREDIKQFIINREKRIKAEIRQEIIGEIEKHLDWWKEDIVGCFIPKCSCGKPATTQTEKGKDAQKNNHRPVNWGYYCDKCYEEGLKMEEEAMFGN